MIQKPLKLFAVIGYARRHFAVLNRVLVQRISDSTVLDSYSHRQKNQTVFIVLANFNDVALTTIGEPFE